MPVSNDYWIIQQNNGVWRLTVVDGALKKYGVHDLQASTPPIYGWLRSVSGLGRSAGWESPAAILLTMECSVEGHAYRQSSQT